MVERLAAKLQQDATDVEGWLRMFRSYQVLGETDKLRAAVSDARRAVQDDPDKLRRLDDGVKQLGIAGRPCRFNAPVIRSRRQLPPPRAAAPISVDLRWFETASRVAPRFRFIYHAELAAFRCCGKPDIVNRLMACGRPAGLSWMTARLVVKCRAARPLGVGRNTGSNGGSRPMGLGRERNGVLRVVRAGCAGVLALALAQCASPTSSARSIRNTA